MRDTCADGHVSLRSVEGTLWGRETHLLLLHQGRDEAALVSRAVGHRVDHDVPTEEVHRRLIGVKAHVPKLAPLQPPHQGHLLICQPHVMPCHPILHGAPVVRVFHLVQKLVQLVPGAHRFVDALAIQVIAHVGEVGVPLQGHVAHRVPDVLLVRTVLRILVAVGCRRLCPRRRGPRGLLPRGLLRPAMALSTAGPILALRGFLTAVTARIFQA